MRSCHGRDSSGQGVEGVEAAGVLGARLVVALHGVVEGPLRVEQLDEARFAAAVRIRGGVADVARLARASAARSSRPARASSVYCSQALRSSLVMSACSACDPRRGLARFLARALDLALVAVEDRQRRADEEAPFVAGQRTRRHLPMKLGADGVVDLALRQLQADVGGRPCLIAFAAPADPAAAAAPAAAARRRGSGAASGAVRRRRRSAPRRSRPSSARESVRWRPPAWSRGS